MPQTAQSLKPDLTWPDDGEKNVPVDPSDPRAILRDMIDAGLVDTEIGLHLYVTLEAYRRGIIEL